MRIRVIALVIVLSIIFTGNTFSQNDSIPPLNKKVVEYVHSVMGTQVDRGECWDLANQALILINANWNKEYVYGNVVDYKKDEVFPGDIVHFKNVVVKQTKGLTTITETMEQHTAIIIKVYGKGIYELAHQNTGFSGRKVGTSPIDLNGVVKGKVIIYRPVQ